MKRYSLMITQLDRQCNELEQMKKTFHPAKDADVVKMLEDARGTLAMVKTYLGLNNG